MTFKAEIGPLRVDDIATLSGRVLFIVSFGVVYATCHLNREAASSEHKQAHLWIRLQNMSMGFQSRRHHFAADIWYNGTIDRHF
jgi:NO-binding membrane sensor protein with MHYT domain